MIAAFLRFLESDMARFPRQIQPLDPALMKRIDDLVGHLTVDPEEDLGDEPSI